MPGLVDFAGQAVLVTGVGRVGQIGHAVAEGFGKAGARLVICDVSAVNVAARAREFVERGFECRAAAGDLTEPDVAQWAVEEAVQAYGQLDVVVNAAGGLTGVKSMLEAETAVFDREMAINVKTAYLVSRAAAKVMVAQRRGAIVNFASIAAFHGRAEMVAYTAAKAGVAAMSRSMALELRDQGVRVNAVAPGTARTPENLATMGAAAVRWVDVSDIVNAVLFLASGLAAGITGHVLPVSHGEV
ncbi:MAG TPA: SDR family NAD(P)-dependent oxidoreductase [Gemmatimonadales bacterium]|nr:SDR family NAD(P)-dependent oxidoreductase [Gemmatimonadales bacterium]